MKTDPNVVELIRSVWANLRVPIRPGPEGLELYRETMRSLPRKRVLVLGATPELVDIALDVNAEKVVSVERNPNMIEAMRRIGRRDWSKVELIIGNWLEDHPQFHSSFDCIVNDGGLLFLEHPGQWSQLFELAYKYLSPGGLFVAKEWAEPSGERDYEEMVDGLIERFKSDSKGLGREEFMELYKHAACQILMAALVGATRSDGTFDQEILVSRLDSMADRLCAIFPDPEMMMISRTTMLNVSRSQPGATDVITGIPYEGTAKLLADHGFVSENHPLPDPPVPGGNYMFVARKL